MIYRLTLTLIIATMSLLAHAQNGVTGIVADGKTKQSIPGAVVTVLYSADTTQTNSVATAADGSFKIDNLKSGKYTLRATFIGYATITQAVVVTTGVTNVGTIALFESAVSLNEVEIDGQKNAAQQKGDTSQFNAKAFKTNPDATVGDLVTKIPGVTVDNTGTVTAHGEKVTNVLVDGKPFFGGNDPTMALKNLPADVVDKIQIFDQQSDQSAFTGFDDGNSVKTMNFVTKGMTHAFFGKLYAGYGTDDRYTAGESLNYFNGQQRITLLGLFNNINQQNFSSQDLLGVLGNGGRRGGGGGTSFMTGQQVGITNTNSAGINYSDVWGKKVTVTASYFFNSTNNINTSATTRNYFNNQLYNEYDTTTNYNYNHRANARLTYTIDPNNSFILTPTYTYQYNKATTPYSALTGIGDSLINQTANHSTSNNSGYTFSNDLLFRHKFGKTGRTFSWDIYTQLNDKTGVSNQQSINQYYQESGKDSITDINQNANISSKGYTVKSSMSYTEPLSKRSMIQLNYTPSYTYSNSDQETYNFNTYTNDYNVLDTLLSNKYTSKYISQQGGVSYRVRTSKLNLSLGANYQYAILDGSESLPDAFSLQRTFNSVLPNAVFMYKFATGNTLRIFYRTNTNAPSISQLQSVINNSNPLQLGTGNPDLKQSYNQVLFARWGIANPNKKHSIFLFGYGSYTQNYIANSTIVAHSDSLLADNILLHRGSQLIYPVNINGSWSTRANFVYSVPLKFIKTNLNLNAGGSYNRTPGLINNDLSISNSYGVNSGIVLASNISQNVDFTLSYMPSYNIVKNSLQPQLNDDYFNHLFTAKLNWIIWKGIFINTELDQTLYQGTPSSIDQHFLLWNAAIGKKFFKNQNGDIRASVFDMLNQNNSINRTVADTYIQDVQSQVLHRYFMLTFTYTIKPSMYKNLQKQDNNDHHGFHMPPGGPPPGGGGPPPGGG